MLKVIRAAVQDYDTAVEHYSAALDALAMTPAEGAARTRVTQLLNRAQVRPSLLSSPLLLCLEHTRASKGSAGERGR